MTSGEKKDMLTQDEFQLLFALHEMPGVTQRQLTARLGVSLGKVNKLLASARERGWIGQGNYLTDSGLRALEPYKVHNAIIMAAGTSSRFAPLSYEKPKGLFLVKSEVLIERQIRQLQERGIHEIYVVVGYMKELFYYLEKKLGVHIITNNEYAKRNNLSSVMAAKAHFHNSYLCYSDNYLQVNGFQPYVYRSYFAAQYSEGYTEEYVIISDKHGKITQYYPEGEACYYQMGEMYFDAATAESFIRLLEKEYNYPGVADMKVDEFYMRHLSSLDFYIKKNGEDDVLEFDNISEIEKFDDKFLRNMGDNILTNICDTLHCKETDITEVAQITAGNTNVIFRFNANGQTYIYRHPGLGSDKIIDRQKEYAAMKKAAEIGLDPTLIACDPVKGWKICRYIENVSFDYENLTDERRAVDMLRQFHGSPVKYKRGFELNLITRAREICALMPSDIIDARHEYAQIRKDTEQLYIRVLQDGYEPEMCHNDCCDSNILLGKTATYLIDWEYAGDNDPAVDIATFIIGCRHDREAVDRILLHYFRRELTFAEKRHFYAYIAISAYFYFTWGIFEESLGKDIGDLSYIWYNYIIEYLPLTLELYEEGKNHAG